MAGPAGAASLAFFANQAGEYDYGLQLELPPDFGSGELSLELLIQLEESFPVGSTSGGEGQRLNWSDSDEEPYSGCCWWFPGNFLLDGHNNADFSDGTFSLQLYGGGRLRWLFGDGADPGPGGVWAVQAWPAATTPSLLDGEWHHVVLVRRFTGASEAQLELWIDGSLVASETSTVRTDMGVYWDSWSGFPTGQEGWFWAAEKQAAIGVLSQYEDYKGLLDELRFWNRALSPAEIEAGAFAQVQAGALGLVGRYALDEGSGVQGCDTLAPTPPNPASRCLDLVDPMPGTWSGENAPLVLFADGFETGTTSAWTVPGEASP